MRGPPFFLISGLILQAAVSAGESSSYSTQHADKHRTAHLCVLLFLNQLVVSENS